MREFFIGVAWDTVVATLGAVTALLAAVWQWLLRRIDHTRSVAFSAHEKIAAVQLDAAKTYATRADLLKFEHDMRGDLTRIEHKIDQLLMTRAAKAGD